MNLCDQALMHEAIGLARRGMGWCSPNPPVGALVVDQAGQIVGRGWHKKAGGAHAEVAAIEDAGGVEAVEGRTLYVTLEPCSTYGRTPPCVDLIIKSNIRRVVIGCKDPNPVHAGRGIDILREAGVETTCGVGEVGCLELIRGFAKRVTTGRPWVVMKAAVSLDGKINRPDGERRWLTGEEARADAHELRGIMDAIVVGAGTVLADDPLLTVRVPDASYAHGRHILRVILAGHRKLPESAQLFQTPEDGETLVLQDQTPEEVLDDLGHRGVNMVLIEGGARVFASFLGAGLVDEVIVYLAPIFCGGSCLHVLSEALLPGSICLKQVEAKMLGCDLRFSGRIHALTGC